MSLNKNTKPVQIDTFEPASDMRWLQCLSCNRRINIFGDAKSDPETFGQLSKNPETQTHSCEISCRCGVTRVKAWGKMKSIVSGPRSCFGFEVSTERVYDKPCYCRENKGSEPGHVHASRPAAESGGRP